MNVGVFTFKIVLNKIELFNIIINLTLDDPSEIELEKKESSMSNRDLPSTSKFPSMTKDDYSSYIFDENQQHTKSLYFMQNSDTFYNTSSLMKSESSSASLSEEKSEESLPNHVTEEKIILGLFIIMLYVYILIRLNYYNFFKRLILNKLKNLNKINFVFFKLN